MTDNIEFKPIAPKFKEDMNCEQIILYEDHVIKSAFLKCDGVLVCGGCVFPGQTDQRKFDGIGYYSGPYWVRGTDYHNGKTSPLIEKAIDAFLYEIKPTDFKCRKVDAENVEGHFLWDIRNGGGPYIPGRAKASFQNIRR